MLTGQKGALTKILTHTLGRQRKWQVFREPKVTAKSTLRGQGQCRRVLNNPWGVESDRQKKGFKKKLENVSGSTELEIKPNLNVLQLHVEHPAKVLLDF